MRREPLVRVWISSISNGSKMRLSLVQVMNWNSTVQYSTVQYSTVQYSIVQYSPPPPVRDTATWSTRYTHQQSAQSQLLLANNQLEKLLSISLPLLTGSFWGLLGPYGSFLVLLGPSGSIWVHLCPSGWFFWICALTNKLNNGAANGRTLQFIGLLLQPKNAILVIWMMV